MPLFEQPPGAPQVDPRLVARVPRQAGQPPEIGEAAVVIRIARRVRQQYFQLAFPLAPRFRRQVAELDHRPDPLDVGQAFAVAGPRAEHLTDHAFGHRHLRGGAVARHLRLEGGPPAERRDRAVEGAQAHFVRVVADHRP